MEYEKINWKDSPDQRTPVSARLLGKMDQGIKDAATELSAHERRLNSTESSISTMNSSITSIQTDVNDLKQNTFRVVGNKLYITIG